MDEPRDHLNLPADRIVALANEAAYAHGESQGEHSPPRPLLDDLVQGSPARQAYYGALVALEGLCELRRQGELNERGTGNEAAWSILRQLEPRALHLLAQAAVMELDNLDWRRVPVNEDSRSEP